MHFIFQVTFGCNFKCLHCFADAKEGAPQISLEDAVVLMNKIPSDSEVVFHGGEPTLLGVDFYVNLIERCPQHRYSMQTNLYLFDDRWARFAVEYMNGRVSSSFDPYLPSSLKLRPFSKKDFYERILLLRKYGIRPYIISTFWRGNQDVTPEGWFKIFKEAGVNFRINFIEKLGRAALNYDKYRPDKGKYAKLLIGIFDLWFLKEREIIVDPLAEILLHFLSGNSTFKCPFSSDCANYIACISFDGNVYPCGGFNFPEFRYGNLLKESFEKVFSSPKRLEAIKRKFMLPEKCKKCPYFSICQGGCRLEAYGYYKDIYMHTSLCEEYRLIFRHIEKRIERESLSVVTEWLSELELGSRLGERGKKKEKKEMEGR